MSKPYQNLPEAMKGIITQMGERVIEDNRLVNILADVYALDEIPAVKSVLRKIISSGYGAEIFSYKDNPTWDIKEKLLVAKIVAQDGFKEDLTQFVIDSILYGLGKIDEVPKINITSDTETRRIVDLDLELRKLKNAYLSYIEDNVMISDDKPAYYLTNDKSEIYEYREKIILLSSFLGKDNQSWCDENLNQVIEKYAPKSKFELKKGFFKRIFGFK